METTPTVPDGILLQVSLVTPHDEEAGYRIYTDGRYESRPLGEAWKFGSPLTPSQVEAVQAAIATAAFETLQPSYEPLSLSTDEDGGVSWYQIVDDSGEINTVKVVNPCRVPAIDSLSNQLVSIFKQ